MRSFTIMVDSDCDLPCEYIVANNIQIMPMPFTYDGQEHPGGDWRDITGKDFYAGLRQGRLAGTALINMYAFTRVFTEYAERDEDLLIILLSSGLSATYQNAQIALTEVQEKYPHCNIQAIDSISATSGCGLLAALAVQKRDQGLDVHQTATWLEEKKHSCHGVFMVDDLMYLHRGGRLSKLQAVAGSAIGIKPLLYLTPTGTLAIREKARGHKGAMTMLIKQFRQIIGPDAALDTVFISHTDCLQEAELFTTMVQEAAHVKQVVTLLMGPVIGTHLGPGALTLLFEGAMPRADWR